MTMFLQPGRFHRGRCAQRHGVVSGDDAADVSVRLQDRFGLLKRLGLRPVGGLGRHELQCLDAGRARRESPLVRTCALVSDSRPSNSAYSPPCGPMRAGKLRGNDLRALIVVCDDLRLGDARRLDLAIDQEAR